MPNLSYIPLCFFGKEASHFWNLRDYSENDVNNDLTLQEYQECLISHYDLKEPNFYRYPKCKMFSSKPTDSGICHTFNGLEIKKILKDSFWSQTFSQTFESSDSGNIFKSEGIDLHDGFVISIDTLQSYMINMEVRESDQKEVNAFWIKVHPAGEIPWITKDKSSWKKIYPQSHEMSTKFVTLKGEKIEGKDSFKEIPSYLRKCLFPDEGNLEVFEFYSEANCNLECSWKKAEEICGCKPWFIPAKDGTTMCFVLGNICFEDTMKKIELGKISADCNCQEDCVINRYTLSVKDKTVLERTTTRVWTNKTGGIDVRIGTDELDGNDYTKTHWYNMGEYLKDLDQKLLPQDPLLNHKIPRPLVEKGHCLGIWTSLESPWLDDTTDYGYSKRDCNDWNNPFYLQPLAKLTSKVILIDE